ncbi:aminotransferase class IV, partial [Mycolicibacterium mucogenicum]
MTTPPPTVVAVDGCQAAIRADDPVFCRGDGVFETALVRDGVVRLLDEHLTRLAASAALAG